MLIVTEAKFTSAEQLTTCVRVTAGRQQVCTQPDPKGKFLAPLSVFVEQGCDALVVELMDEKKKKVLARLDLDVVEDIVMREEPYRDHVFSMAEMNKRVLRPKLMLTILKEARGDEESPVLAGINLDPHDATSLLVMDQLRQVQTKQAQAEDEEEQELVGGARRPPAARQKAQEGRQSQTALLAGGNTGPVEMLTGFGSWSKAWVSVKGPPESKKFLFCVWDNEVKAERGEAATEEVDLLKVMSVQPDPHREEVFVVTWRTSPKVKQFKQLTLQRVDRPRDVWVQLLTLMINKAREKKKESKPRK